MTLPFMGFSFAVSGMMMPPGERSSSSSRWTMTRSCNGLNFMLPCLSDWKGVLGVRRVREAPKIRDWHSNTESAKNPLGVEVGMRTPDVKGLGERGLMPPNRASGRRAGFQVCNLDGSVGDAFANRALRRPRSAGSSATRT